MSVMGLSVGRIVVFLLLLLVFTISISVNMGSADSSGGVTTLAMALCLASIPKNSLLHLLLGVSFERAVVWHKMLALCTLILGCLHGFVAAGKLDLGDGDYLSGLIAIVLMGVMMLGSFFPLRRA